MIGEHLVQDRQFHEEQDTQRMKSSKTTPHCAYA
jgi:hypothetical protein